jgi:hypothetical protein
MLAITLGEILGHVEEFEGNLKDFYAKLSTKTTHEGVRLLTDYMSRHSFRIHNLLAFEVIFSPIVLYQKQHLLRNQI